MMSSLLTKHTALSLLSALLLCIMCPGSRPSIVQVSPLSWLRRVTMSRCHRPGPIFGLVTIVQCLLSHCQKLPPPSLHLPSKISDIETLSSHNLTSWIEYSIHTFKIELFRQSFQLVVRCPLYFMIKFWDFATKFWLALLHKFLNGHLRIPWVGWRPGLTALAAIFANIKQIWDPEIKWTKNGHNYKQ